MHMTFGPSHGIQCFHMSYVVVKQCAYGESVQVGCWGIHSMRRWENNMCTLQAKYYNNKNVLQFFSWKKRTLHYYPHHPIQTWASPCKILKWMTVQNDNNDARGNQNNINKTSVILSVLHTSSSSAGGHILTFITKSYKIYLKKKITTLQQPE